MRGKINTYPYAEAWRSHRNRGYWQEKADRLYEIVSKLQTRLRQTTDFLLQNELRSIEQGRHRCDYEATIERMSETTLGIPRRSELPADLFQTIEGLIKLDTVQSVSCPFTDFALWRLLVTEQVRRAQRLGVDPQKAFALCGPDSRPPHVKAEDWGGKVHIPYEGALEGDLFILPGWRVFRPEHAQDGGSLAAALRVNHCQYALSPKDYGKLQSATRTRIGDWVLYESKLPYVPGDPF